MENPFLLQTFKSQGLSYILFDSSDEKKEHSTLAPKEQTAQPLAQSMAEAYKNKIASTSAIATQFKEQAKAVQQGKTIEFTKPKTLKTNFTTQKAQVEPEIPPLYENILPLSKWNKDWKLAHQRCKLPTERPKNLSRQVVWTYAGLEQDLFTDSPNADRREVLANIIKALAHPRGTHLFLPYKLCINGSMEFAMDNGNSFFWSAMDLIRPRVLVVFGQETLKDLSLPPLVPTQKYTLSPITIYGLDTILHYAHDPKNSEIMTTFLQTNLRMFV